MPEMQPTSPPGLFITFEGADGVGKTAHADALQEHLHNRGLSTLRTREPAGTAIGDQIREHVLRSGSIIDPHAQALLFAADRAQNINTHVAPALRRGVTIIQERYIDSATAWAEAQQILNPREIRDLGLWAGSGLMPDITILLDVHPERSLEIAVAAGLDEDLDFHQRLRQSFNNIARREPHRFLLVDAEQRFEDVHNLIVWEVRRRFAS
tara:strand:+ start:82272 stop:82901 length:630 start_codon:yes stop_codon:yes gene_type:complete